MKMTHFSTLKTVYSLMVMTFAGISQPRLTWIQSNHFYITMAKRLGQIGSQDSGCQVFRLY